MKADEIARKFTERFGPGILETKLDVLQPWCVVGPTSLEEVATFARDEAGLKFDFLRSIAAVDYLAENVIELVYLLFSYSERHEFKLKVRLPRDNPRVASVERIWPAANWHEREAYDLLGVIFEGHSDLRRLLLPDDWIGHPLRKDYREQEEYGGVSTTREYLTGMTELPTRPGPAQKQGT